ncbi:MAG: hypothetical protein IH898_13435 [Planctomycetes bacterium]|nr:hypothetical protein [Planctomycetota bacterium]
MQFTARNTHGLTARWITRGATLVELHVPDREGQLADVVLGFDDEAGYRSGDNQHFGCTTGRYANRIRGGRFTLDGVERMRQRPIGGLIDALQVLGAGAEYLGEPGYPPVRVHAQGLGGGHVRFSAPQSSQLISSVMLAAPCAARDVFIEAVGPVPSVPYLKLTTAVMERFGVAVVEQYDDRGARFVVEARK